VLPALAHAVEEMVQAGRVWSVMICDGRFRSDSHELVTENRDVTAFSF
jgi:hypothetical protein